MTTFSHLPHFNSSRIGIDHATVPSVRCPACEQGSAWVQFERITDRYGFDWTLSTCGTCGLEWQLYPLTDDARHWFYASGEYRRLCEQVTGKSWTNPVYLLKAQEEYAHRWVSEWSPYAPPFANGRWLDYGGSTGVVSRYWEEHHDGENIEIVVADYGDGATTSPEEAIQMGKASPYDAVICCQVLDHLPRPLETLKTFLTVTRAGGTLFCDVVKKGKTAYKVDHDTYWPSAACFLGMVERAGWTVDWLDAVTDENHWAIGARKP